MQFASQILDAVEGGKRPTVEPSMREDSPDGFVEIMEKCWSQDPEARPAFNHISFALNEVAIEEYKDSQEPKRRSLRPTNASSLEQSLSSARRKHGKFRMLKILEDAPDGTKHAEATTPGDIAKAIEMSSSGTSLVR